MSLVVDEDGQPLARYWHRQQHSGYQEALRLHGLEVLFMEPEQWLELIYQLACVEVRNSIDAGMRALWKKRAFRRPGLTLTAEGWVVNEPVFMDWWRKERGPCSTS